MEQRKVIDSHGLVMVEYDDILKQVTEVYKKLGLDPVKDEIAEQIEELSSRLSAKKVAQNNVVISQITREYESIPREGVSHLLKWMDSSIYEAEKVVFEWDTANNPNNTAALQYLFDIHRHALVASKLKLQVPEIELPTFHPTWISGEMESSLSISQVHLLERFKWLQNSVVSCNDWLAYFAKVHQEIDDNEGSPPENQTENHERLSRLLNFPVDDVAQLAAASNGPQIGIENACIATIQHADYVARRITICRDAAIGAAELAALEAVGTQDFDWTAANAAALHSLQNFEAGAYVSHVHGLLDEETRDALVGTYLSKVAWSDETLKEIVTSDEALYQYLLVDVKVSKEVPTTRMLENIGSVQLFINNMLSGLEDGSFEDRVAFRQTWEVSQQYRIWEANEKLKLYPSTYIEPQLRIGKSEIFEQFEQDMTQGNLDEDTIESAVHGYITRLQQLSELRCHGFFFTRNMDTTIYYLTARATWEKHGFYYRKLEIERQNLGTETASAVKWGDWRKATLPITVEHVYGVIPAFAWNRLFLFWLELRKETTDSSSNIKNRYFLQPQLCRQNLDSTFTDPWSPTLSDDVDLEVTHIVDAVGLSSYEPPIYQPFYDIYNDSLVAYFDKAEPDVLTETHTTHEWVLLGNTSRSVVEEKAKVFNPGASLPDYAAVPTGLQGVNYEFAVEPTAYVGSLEYEDVHGNYVEISNYEVTVKGMDLANKELKISWTAERACFKPVLSDQVVRAVCTVMILGETATGNSTYFLIHTNAVATITKSGETTFSPEDFIYPLMNTDKLAEAGRGTITVYSTVYILVDDSGTIPPSQCQQYGEVFNSELYKSHLMYGLEKSKRGGERYLMNEDVTHGTITVSLFSTGIQEITSKAFPGSHIRSLLALENQRPAEKGVPYFLGQINDSEYGPVQDPKPDRNLDYNGAYGLYAWELFYYIPSMIASAFRQGGLYQKALSWQEAIYDPKAHPDQRWKVWPLIDQSGARTFSVTDPDEIAREQPRHYQLATIRHYLQIIMEQGDAYYRQETAETLRQAKMTYVEAEALFLREGRKHLETSTRDDWSDPTLTAVSDTDFRPPINQDVRGWQDTIRQRLYNLRNWLSIDGKPLNISLVPASIDPRKLVIAASAGLPLSQTTTATQVSLPYTFDTALGKAKAAVENLMYLGDLLTRGLQQRDRQSYEELQVKLSQHVVENFEVGGQESLITSLKMELDVLMKDKEQAEKYKKWYAQFAEELANGHEKRAYTALMMKRALHATAMTQAIVKGGLKMIPNIFGLSVGGSRPEGAVEAGKEISEHMAESHSSAADFYFHKGEVERRQQENEMEKEAAALAVQSLQLSIDQLKFDISEEEGTLIVLKEKSRQTEALVEFQARRSTNADFYKWYVGQVTSLYNSAYDITLRFCRLAERAYQVEMGEMTRFINPVWDATFHGLLSGQSLMLDLQRMDYAFMERYNPPSEGMVRFSVRSVNPVWLSALKSSGRTVFNIAETSLFNQEFSYEYERRIKSIQIRLLGIPDRAQGVNARLTLIGHQVCFGRGNNRSRTAHNAFGRQQISLLEAETNTEDIKPSKGRFRPFERCGIDSTWMLSFPTAAQAIEAKQKRYEQKRLLEKLEDVVMDIRYTTRVV